SPASITALPQIGPPSPSPSPSPSPPSPSPSPPLSSLSPFSSPASATKPPVSAAPPNKGERSVGSEHAVLTRARVQTKSGSRSRMREYYLHKKIKKLMM